MKRFRIVLLLAIVLNFVTIAQQQFNFGWLTDIHIGAPGAETDLLNVVNDINQRSEIKFVIASGDITEKGKNSELIQAKNILDNLKIPYYMIPGNHDTKWSESGGTQFLKLWGNDNFVFEFNSVKFIGINSGILLKGGGGHVSPETLKWLDSILTKTSSNQEIYFFTHHPLSSDIDNWFEITNRLRTKNIKAIFHGHDHGNKLFNYNGIPAVMSRSTLTDKKSWGYTIVESRSDSIIFYEMNKEYKQKKWGAIFKEIDLRIPLIDSSQTANYGVKVLWKKELSSTMVHAPIVYKNKIYLSTKNGDIFCYDAKGTQIWKYHVNGTIVSRLAAEDDLIIAATIEGDLLTINANDGKVVQIIGITEPITSQITVGLIPIGGEKYYGILFGTAEGKLYCYELSTLDLIWENSNATGMIETRPLIISDRVVYGSWDGYMYCIDLKSGMLNWSWSENTNFYYSPAASVPVTDGKNLYVPTPDKFVSAVDLLLGRTIWRKNDFAAWESIGINSSYNHLYVKSMSDKFYVVNPKDGRRIKEINLKYGLDTTPNEIVESKGNVIFNGKNGIIYSLNNKFETKPLLFLGTARTLSTIKINENTFLASNMDGRIILFSIQ
ncbi:MAG: metallophosphoesterase [Ignavibacteria bacterium]|nr:metallophosphoesterase [Ignavibacteria bacterium]